MGVANFLFGKSSTASRVIELGASGLDKLNFSEQERAQYHIELQKLHLNAIEHAASESTAQSISRRMICLPVVYLWLFFIVIHVVRDLFGFGASEAIALVIDELGIAALAAIGFYVGRHIVQPVKPK